MVWDSGLGNKCEGDGYGQFKMYGYIYIPDPIKRYGSIEIYVA